MSKHSFTRTAVSQIWSYLPRQQTVVCILRKLPWKSKSYCKLMSAPVQQHFLHRGRIITGNNSVMIEIKKGYGFIASLSLIKGACVPSNEFSEMWNNLTGSLMKPFTVRTIFFLAVNSWWTAATLLMVKTGLCINSANLGKTFHWRPH